MKNLSIFEPQIEKHYAYKKKHVINTGYGKMKKVTIMSLRYDLDV